MSKPNQIRYGGSTPILGGALFVALFALGGLVDSGALAGTFFESRYWGHQVLHACLHTLLAVSVTGLYIRHAIRLGRLGMTGFYLGSAGFALAILGSLVAVEVELSVGEGATPEWLDGGTHMLAALLFLVGSLAFGAAANGVGVLPRGGAALLVAGPLLLLGMLFGGIEGWPLMAPAVLLGAGWARLACALLSEEKDEQPTGQAARAVPEESTY